MKAALRLLLAPYRFSVDRLFRMGQDIGWHWQFDDPLKRVGIPYEWVDTAGTTPTTAVGQGIGLLLGREYGGATGPSLLANGATGLTGTATAASYNTSTFAGSVSRAGDASNQSWVTWTGLTTSAVHRIRITNTGATSLDVRNGGVAGTIVASIAAGASSWVHPATTGGSTSITITATSNSTTATFTLGQFAVLPGTHLTQATGTARPTLSARVNTLLNSEDFSSASWNKSRATVTANAATAPNGTLTADKIVEDTATNNHRVFQAVTKSAAVASAWVFSVSLKAAERGFATVKMSDNFEGDQGEVGINLSTGEVSAFVGTFTNMSVTVVDEGNGWWRVKFTATCDTDSQVVAWVQIANALGTSVAYTGDGTSGIYAWGADLRTADDAAKNIPVYQRVGATAADHDTDGFPHGQYPDGTDDNQTTTTGGGGTTGFFYCGAITVSGGAGTARTIWSDTGTNTGYRVRVNSSNKLELAAGNGSAYTTVQSNETITAPGTYLLSAWDDGGVLAVQVNNLAPATTTRPTVSAGTSTITVYKDNGAASSYFNGRDYGSVYAQRYIGETAHNRLKRYLANVARITV